ncbi:hypothetical protein KIY80_gp75 [Mycobacterium phage Benvolio]|uniref:Uncharacterized protein n=1 Tax=Mycobacterium phage Benvolio TaxID=2591074 RepID=A0A514A3R2_9CAUD|nr:hypothetical protein CH13_gp078 [Mycobacterium phage Echild]YP_010063512.1 hypothetical protein KIY80_gp75 [Mycobacterium phage Benvolio]AHG24299.1 hypothetical protein PBI_ECHILD_78 [Mycobacterium phage Echild]QDH47891.1 hypothetical protein SEA_BENVOLIO_75 [Mycobacterium phage Benvolio]
MDQNVYVVVDPDGRLLPYIADDFEDAIRQHTEGDGAEFEGIFIYGSSRVGLR